MVLGLLEEEEGGTSVCQVWPGWSTVAAPARIQQDIQTPPCMMVEKDGVKDNGQKCPSMLKGLY